jgi:hypothetical protein
MPFCPYLSDELMRRQQRITVELSIQILRAAMAPGDRIHFAAAPIRLALWCRKARGL